MVVIPESMPLGQWEAILNIVGKGIETASAVKTQKDVAKIQKKALAQEAQAQAAAERQVALEQQRLAYQKSIQDAAAKKTIMYVSIAAGGGVLLLLALTFMATRPGKEAK